MKYALTATLLIAAALVGCRSVTPPSRGRADVTDHRRVFFETAHQDQLQNSTALDAERISRDQFGLLTVTIPIRSTVRRSLYLEYNYEFFDASGKSVEGPLGWRRLSLDGGTPTTIQFTSTSEVAEDYRVSIRFQK